MERKKEIPYVIEVDGVQVFSSDFVFEQMQAQSRRIDRARSIAMLAMAMAVLSFIGLVALAVILPIIL